MCGKTWVSLSKKKSQSTVNNGKTEVGELRTLMKEMKQEINSIGNQMDHQIVEIREEMKSIKRDHKLIKDEIESLRQTTKETIDNMSEYVNNCTSSEKWDS